MVKNFAHLGLIQITNSLLQIVLFPFIFRMVGLEEFGKVMLANSFAWLLSIVVTWGSGQSGITDIATLREHPLEMSRQVRLIMQSRLLVFACLLLLMLGWYLLHGANAFYFLLAMPIVLGEVLNPLFYFVGKESTSKYNLVNVVAKLVTLGLMFVCIKNTHQAAWVNFVIGSTNALFFGGLLAQEYLAKRIVWVPVASNHYRTFFTSNSFLVGNNLTVYLQQSIFLFAISATGQAAVLGAYSLCDKLIWSFRIIMVAFFNAVFPKGALLFNESVGAWSLFKQHINRYIGGIFLIWAIAQFLFADWAIHIVAGKPNAMAAHFLQWMCLVPFLIALNLLNVMELFFERNNKAIFFLGAGIAGFAALVGFLLIQFDQHWYGLFSFFAEGFSLLLYTLYLDRKKNKSVA